MCDYKPDQKAKTMWRLIVFLMGIVSSHVDGINYNLETIAGQDMNLKCLGTKTIDSIIGIKWRRSNGSILFECEEVKNPCANNISSSTLPIRNVSVFDEDGYTVLLIFWNYQKTCKFNLTVNAPPKGLILVEEADGTILRNHESLTVGEWENKTLVCKTNTSVKPPVDLEWVIPKELNVFVDSQKHVKDERDDRLLVLTRKIQFTPTYEDGKDIVLVCKFASNSSFDQFQTSVLITNKGELTTDSKTRGPGSEESRTMTASTGDFQVHFTGSGTTDTTLLDPSDQGHDKPWYTRIRIVIPGFSGVVTLFIVLAFVGGSFRSKKRNGRRSINAESTEIRPLQGRRSLPPTPSDHLPDQPPPTARLLRPVPSIPSDNPMRPLVPVSEDAIIRPAERTGSRMPGETFTTTDGRTPVTQVKKELDTEMEYDLLNISHHGAPGAVPHVYRETPNGLAEYALVSRQQVDKRIDQRQRHRSKEMDDDSDYDLLNTWNQAEHGTVPHVYRETKSGLAEYAVVSKPDDRKKRQSLGPLTKVMKAPINVEAEYAVVDKSKKRAK